MQQLYVAMVADDSGRAPSWVGDYATEDEAWRSARECAASELPHANPRAVVRRMRKVGGEWVPA